MACHVSLSDFLSYFYFFEISTITFTTRDIIMSRDIDIATCHNRDLTHGNKKKLKKSESDTWCVVKCVNFFFLKGT